LRHELAQAEAEAANVRSTNIAKKRNIEFSMDKGNK
jgi:hypothetical protein